MEQEFYTISFKSGSSGRLIANLIWGSIYPNKYSFSISAFNSTHEQTPWVSTVNSKTHKINANTWKNKDFKIKIQLMK